MTVFRGWRAAHLPPATVCHGYAVKSRAESLVDNPDCSFCLQFNPTCVKKTDAISRNARELTSCRSQ